MLGASAAALGLVLQQGAQAQSTGTQALESVETINVSANSGVGGGVMKPIEVPKERATISQEFINTQTAGQTVFESLNVVPGFNFTNNDAYGNSGGDVRLHGFDGNRISFTWDGMPLNDTGNYAIYTNQVADAEILGLASVNQGSTDADSPTAAATGGVIALQTSRPLDTFGILTDGSVGSFNRVRLFGRIDTGAFGPWGTTAFVSGSYTDYEKWKGPGKLHKLQFNGEAYQDLGAVGWVMLAVHWNSNRNNFYNTVSFLPVNASNFTATGGIAAPCTSSTPGCVAFTAPNVALDSNGDYVGVGSPNPTVFAQAGQGYGLKFDYFASCTPTAGVTGTAQGVASCGSNFYKVRINPSDTGNVRIASLINLSDSLKLTFDPSLQYVLANGGGTTTLYEGENRIRGNTTASQSLNGDGDTLDTVLVYSPSNTNTIRYGLNTSLLWLLNDTNTFQLGYTLDYGLHRQTGQMAYLDANGAPFDVFGGYKDKTDRVLSADGTPIRSRDRRSRAILNQIAFAYDGHFLNDTITVDAAVRAPFLERDLNNLCYEMVAGSGGPGIGFPYCTSAAPVSTNAANNTVTLGGNYNSSSATLASALFVAPAKKVVKYNRVLPNLGISWKPFGPEHLIYAAFASSLSAPRTDNLYNGGNNGKCTNASGVLVPTQAGCVFSSFSTVKPETSQTLSGGYRYNADIATVSLDVYTSQFKNRIVTTFDADQGISVDRNIGNVNLTGVDLAVNLFPMDGLALYSGASYEHTKVQPSALSTIRLSATGASIALAGKELVETPNWTFNQRIQYKVYGFTFGFGYKFYGRTFATDDNSFKLPGYTLFNADIAYDLANLGWKGASIRLNGQNLFDKKYLTDRTTRTCFTYIAPTTAGCTSAPFFNVGSPRSIDATLRVAL